MINTSPEGQLPQKKEDKRYSPIIPFENTFCCYGALGVSESQVEKEEEACSDVASDLNFIQMDDMTLEEKLALDNILSSPIELADLAENSLPMHFMPETGYRRRKTSNGDDPSRMLFILFSLIQYLHCHLSSL
jgi:hypothetical protein